MGEGDTTADCPRAGGRGDIEAVRVVSVVQVGHAQPVTLTGGKGMAGAVTATMTREEDDHCYSSTLNMHCG